MARSRNIKPGFFKNEKLVDLPFQTRLLFIGLWTLADREGRMENRPKRIKMEIFPADNVDIDASLKELENSGFIMRYSMDNHDCIQILNFLKHQKPHFKEAPSTLPSHTSTNLGSGEHQPRTLLAALIPDSLNLIPDSLVVTPSISETLVPVDICAPAKTADARKKFVKPTINEVLAYCGERNNNINAVSFINSYEAKGWMIGKSPMKNWKAAIRTWEGNDYDKGGQNGKNQYTDNSAPARVERAIAERKRREQQQRGDAERVFDLSPRSTMEKDD